MNPEKNTENSNPAEPSNPFECVIFFIRLPALKDAPAGGRIIARHFQEKFERVLETNGLLLKVPDVSNFAPQFFAVLKTVLGEFVDKNKAFMDSIKKHPALTEAQKDSQLAVFEKFAGDAEGLLRGRAELVHPAGEGLIATLYVTDGLRSLPVIEAELGRLGFLEGAEIGLFDFAKDVVYSHFPRNTIGHVEQRLLLLLKKYGTTPTRQPKSQ